MQKYYLLKTDVPSFITKINTYSFARYQPLILNTLFILSVLIAFYRGFRLPSLFSVNYYLTNILDGFYRRSLIGTILWIFGDLRFHYAFIASIQVFVLFLLLTLIMISTFHKTNHFKVIAILYFLSPAGVFLFHEVGYPDQLNYALLLLVLTSPYSRLNFLIMMASLWIHENAFLTILPIYFLDLVIKKKDISALVTTAACAFISLALILEFSTPQHESLVSFAHYVRDHADYPIRKDFYEIFLSSPKYSFASSILKFHAFWYDRHTLFDAILALGICLVVASTPPAKGQSTDQSLREAIAVFIAGMSPLLIGDFAWDTDRWVFMCYSSIVIVLSLRVNNLPSNSYRLILFLFICFVLFGQLSYFDFFAPRALVLYPDFYQFIVDELPTLITHQPNDSYSIVDPRLMF